MKLNPQEKKYKEYLKIQRRLDELYQKRRKAIKTPLKEPYQKGWIISFNLSKQALNRADGLIMKAVLDWISVDYTTNDVSQIRLARKFKSWKDFKFQMYTAKNRKGNVFNIKYDLGPHLKPITESQYDSIDQSLQKFFYRREEQITNWSGSNTFTKILYYSNIPEYYIEVKVSPNMITHTTKIDSEILKEEAFLEAKRYELEYNGDAAGKYRNYGSSYPATKDRTRTRDVTRKFLKGEVEDIPNEKIKREYDY